MDGGSRSAAVGSGRELVFRGLWFRVYGEEDDKVNGNELKVLSFNCNLSPKDIDIKERRANVRRFIRAQDADVVFLTENFIVREDSLWLEMQDVYPYRSMQNSSVGNRIYSNFPIVRDTLLKDKVMAYGISCCRVMVQDASTEFSKDSGLQVVGVHLSSNNYNEQMKYMTPDSVATSMQARTYLKNIVTASEYRQREAEQIVEVLSSKECKVPSSKGANGSIIPTIVMGDFNDVCGSPALRVLESAGLTDVWWKGGFGYGATIHDPLPFRIDHIMYNDVMKLRSIKKVTPSTPCDRLRNQRSGTSLSDHDALVATFSIK